MADGRAAASRRRPAVILRPVSFDDADDDDASIIGPPPHPDDRLWRHPSEMAGRPAPSHAASFTGAAGGGDGSPGRPPGHRPWGSYVGFAGAAGAVLVGLAVGVAGIGDRPGLAAPTPARRPRADLGGVPPTDATVALARDAAAPSVVALGPSPAAGPSAAAGRAGSRDDPQAGGPAGTGVHRPPRRDRGHQHRAGRATPGPMEVRLQDGRRVLGQLVGTDPVTGLAVLDLPGAGYPAAKPAGAMPGRGTTVVTVAAGPGRGGTSAETTAGCGHPHGTAPAPAPAPRRGRPPRAGSAPPGGSPARARWRSKAW